MTLNPIQESCTGDDTELVLGKTYGLRMWRLTPAPSLSNDTKCFIQGHKRHYWSLDNETATCAKNGKKRWWNHKTGPHPITDPACTCGFYAYTNWADFQAHTRVYSVLGDWYVFGIIEAWGNVTEGPKGFRAEHAKILGCMTIARRSLGFTFTDSGLIYGQGQIECYSDLRALRTRFNELYPKPAKHDTVNPTEGTQPMTRYYETPSFRLDEQQVRNEIEKMTDWLNESETEPLFVGDYVEVISGPAEGQFGKVVNDEWSHDMVVATWDENGNWHPGYRFEREQLRKTDFLTIMRLAQKNR